MQIRTIDQLLDKLKSNGHEITSYLCWLQDYNNAVKDVNTYSRGVGTMADFDNALNRKYKYYYFLWGAVKMACTLGVINEKEEDLIINSLNSGGKGE